jgi:ribosomal protein S27E
MTEDDEHARPKEPSRTRFVSFGCRGCKRTIELWGDEASVECPHCGSMNDVPARLR